MTIVLEVKSETTLTIKRQQPQQDQQRTIRMTTIRTQMMTLTLIIQRAENQRCNLFNAVICLFVVVVVALIILIFHDAINKHIVDVIINNGTQL